MLVANKIKEAAKQAEELANELKEKIQELKDEYSRLEEFRKLITDLGNSWSDCDPGKYSRHVFFVRSYELVAKTRGLPHAQNIEKFWIAELADKPKEIKRGRRAYDYSNKRVAVPLGTLDEACRERCPKCDKDGVVIGVYYQTYDSPDGDTWQKTLHVLCPHCPAATLFARSISDGRF